MRVLIVGADTPIGLALAQQLEQRGRPFDGLLKADCRWKGERQAKKALRRAECEFVVDTRLQAAADGGIRVHDIDVDRSRWLARASQTLKLPFAHLSAARVFAGDEGRAYREDDYPDGASSIAQLLIAAEAAVRDSCEQHVILRTGPIFAPQGINVVTHMLGQLRCGKGLKLSRRHQGGPIPVADGARVISAMLDQFGCGVSAWGIYHYCSSDITNCYEFAEVLLAAASQFEAFSDGAVQLSTDENEARVSCSLDCSKIKNTFAIKQQPWRVSVAGQVKRYYADPKNKESPIVEE